jgi:hypothetical protein
MINGHFLIVDLVTAFFLSALIDDHKQVFKIAASKEKVIIDVVSVTS